MSGFELIAAGVPSAPDMADAPAVWGEMTGADLRAVRFTAVMCAAIKSRMNLGPIRTSEERQSAKCAQTAGKAYAENPLCHRGSSDDDEKRRNGLLVDVNQ